MDSIEADVEALSELSGLFENAAGRLEAGAAVSQAGPAFQTTARVVEEVLKMAGTAEDLIGIRLRVTGHSLATAANRLASCEETSRAQIAGIQPGLTVL